jgi:uncharacterized protein YdeI (YjbR/CyaY-like superfamily)
MNPKFFKSPAELRKWFEKNHDTATELIVGFYKKGSGLPSVDWPQSVDEAICFGWIDGIRKSIDAKSYQIRFTPRNPKSHWSAVNIRKVQRLLKEGLMKPAGVKVWDMRDETKSKKASYEQSNAVLLSEILEDKIKENPKAWAFFNTKLAPSYKRISIHWVMSAKQQQTQLRRLEILIRSSAEQKKIPLMRKAGE